MSKYDHITQDEFQQKVEDLAVKHGWAWILSLPGVWEIISEELNDDALDALVPDDEEEE